MINPETDSDPMVENVNPALTVPRKAKPGRSNLTSHEVIEAYLDAAIATGDADVIRRALNTVARARRRLTGKASRRRDVGGRTAPETAG